VSSLSSKHKHWHYNANKIISFSSVTGNDDPLGTDTATVVKGPSLLTATGVDRPSPSLFFLPGLRSLPFWTAPYNKDGTLVNTAGSAIAFNDPKVTSIVHHVESYTNQIREEYLSNVFIPPDNDPTTATARQTSNASIGKHAKLMPDYDVNNKGGEHASEALHSGQWDWHSYILSGRRHSHFAGCCPITAKCLDEIGEDLFCSTPFSFAFFSTLQGTATIKVGYTVLISVSLPNVSLLFNDITTLFLIGTHRANEFAIAHSSTVNNAYWKWKMRNSCWLSTEELGGRKGISIR